MQQQHYYHPHEQPLEANIQDHNKTKENHHRTTTSSSSSASPRSSSPRKRRSTATTTAVESPQGDGPTENDNEAASSSNAAGTNQEGVGEEEEGSAEYLTANCLLLTYFNGEASRLVDEHFDRALNSPADEQQEGKSIARTKEAGE